MYYAKAAPLDLNKEYSPSKNSKRFLQTPQPDKAVVNEFLKNITAHTQQARQKYKVRRDVSYKKKPSGDADIWDNQLVDIYYRDKENVEVGYRVVVVDYNLCPTVTLQTLNEQIRNFYEWLFAYAKETQASKISICGHSAGAYMLALLFNKKLLSLPSAERTVSLFLISGIFDLRECWNLPSVNPNNILSLDYHSAEALSPILWELDSSFVELAKERNIRIYVVVGENDSETFKGQSLAYAMKLKAVGVQIEYKILEDYDHFNIIENVPVEGSTINEYILSNLQ